MQPKSSPGTKLIEYRGGVARFRVPADWVEEYGQDGGGTFYKPGDPDGPTLFLEVISATTAPNKYADRESIIGLLRSGPDRWEGPVTELGEHILMVRYDSITEDRGRSLKMRVWRIAQAIPPRHCRHLLFTYTSLAERADEPQCIADRDLLDREIPLTELSPIPHSAPAPPKPWWRVW